MTKRLKIKKIKGGAAARRERCDLLLWKTLCQRKNFDLNNQASKALLFVLKFMAAPITVMFVLLLIKELR